MARIANHKESSAMSDTASDQLTVSDDLYNQLVIPFDEMASPVLPSSDLSHRHRHVRRVASRWHMLSLSKGGRLQPPSADCPKQSRQIRTINQFDFFDSSLILC